MSSWVGFYEQQLKDEYMNNFVDSMKVVSADGKPARFQLRSDAERYAAQRKVVERMRLISTAAELSNVPDEGMDGLHLDALGYALSICVGDFCNQTNADSEYYPYCSHACADWYVQIQSA